MTEKKRGRSAKSLLSAEKKAADKKTTKAKKPAAKRTAKPKTKDTFDETKLLSEQDFFQRVQEKAYELYEQRGYSHGNDLGDWVEAETIIKSEFKV